MGAASLGDSLRLRRLVPLTNGKGDYRQLGAEKTTHSLGRTRSLRTVAPKRGRLRVSAGEDARTMRSYES